MGSSPRKQIQHERISGSASESLGCLEKFLHRKVVQTLEQTAQESMVESVFPEGFKSSLDVACGDRAKGWPW